MKRRVLVGGTMALAAGAAIGVSMMPDGQYERALAAQLAAPRDPWGDVRGLVAYAVLAASSHNTQPWRFRPSGDGIVIAPDFSRRTPVVDPDDHHLFASLGCAAENLAIAAQQYGRAGKIVVGTGGEITVDLSATAPVESPLFAAIASRQCSRSIYDGTLVSADLLRRLAAMDPGVEAMVVTDRTRLESVLELVLAGNAQQLADPSFRAELKSWLRFNANAAARTCDGLLSTASGNPSLPDWLGPLMYELTVTPGGDNERVAAQMRSSAGLVVFSADRDNPSGWMAVGRAYQRFALNATLAGLQHAFVNQAVEVPAVRQQLQSLLGLGTRRANLIVRLGYGPQLPRSLRRPVDAVIDG